MRKMYLILLVFVFNSIICFGSEQIELSSRLGKTITPESRDYFGLFPNVKDFKSAVLIKDSINNYLEITAGKLDIRTTTVISDSSIFALRYVIDNFEKIISNRIKITINPKYAVNYLVIGTKYNNKAKLLRITLEDSTSFQSFIIYSDSNAIVTTPDSIYNPSTSPLRITEYSDIYSISGVSYNIIDRTKEIFVLNLQQFSKYALFTNYNKANVTPPEVLKLINNQTKTNETNYYESKLNFNRLYFKRMMLSVDCSYQILYRSKFGFKVWDYQPEVTLYLTNYYSLGFNFNYKISRSINAEIGYKYELISYKMSDKIYNAIYGNTFNLNLLYNLWHSKKNLYEYDQLFADMLCGVNIHDYHYIKFHNEQYLNQTNSTDLTETSKLSYLFGTRLRYKINTTMNFLLIGFINYYDCWGKVRIYEMTTENIPNNFNYGFSFGFGLEL